DRGQLGDGTTFTCSPLAGDSPSSPCASAAVGEGWFTEVVSLAAGRAHSLALRSDGTVWAWGADTNGLASASTAASSTLPFRVGGLRDAVAIAAGTAHSLALTTDGTVW